MHYHQTERASKHTAFAWSLHEMECKWDYVKSGQLGRSINGTLSVERHRDATGTCTGSLYGLSKSSERTSKRFPKKSKKKGAQ
jgi:hypothetical protein